MAKYIDFDSLGIGKCNPDVFDNEGYAKGWNSAIEILEDAPAADVAPVVHARITEDGACPICGCYIPTDDAHDAIFKSEVHYCYYCGAMMDADMREVDDGD